MKKVPSVLKCTDFVMKMVPSVLKGTAGVMKTVPSAKNVSFFSQNKKNTYNVLKQKNEQKYCVIK